VVVHFLVKPDVEVRAEAKAKL
jgi:tetratricopeptide (TPR) repeat protein